jgi:hypothetical protein
MTLSSLARSAECQELLAFTQNVEIDDETNPDVRCFVNGYQLSNLYPVSKCDNEDLIVHLIHADTPLAQMGIDTRRQCSVHLSTLLRLAIGFIEFQYESIAALLIDKGENVEDLPANSPESKALAYAMLVVRHGLESRQAKNYWDRHQHDEGFTALADGARLRARVISAIAEEAKIEGNNT